MTDSAIAKPEQSLATLRPRPRLFVALLILFVVWIALLVLLNVRG